MANRGSKSMHEALQELDSYYEIERAEKCLKRVFTGLGVDKFINMFTYRIHNLTPSSVTNLNEQFIAFLQVMVESDESGNTNAGINRELVRKCRTAHYTYVQLRKKERK
jgi:hypothetical protein